MTQQYSLKKLDWVLVGCYLFLITFGWMNIYASSSSDLDAGFVLKSKYGMHLIWMGTAMLIATTILFILPSRIYAAFAWWLYIIVAVLLLAVVFVGVEVNGSKSWLAFGSLRLQPAEFSKISTSLVLAAVMSKYEYRFNNRRDMLRTIGILLLPMLFILLEKETGSALVYLGFLFVFYREGMTGWIIVLGMISILLFILTLVLSPFASMLILVGIIALIASFKTRNPLITMAIVGLCIAVASFFPRLGRIELLAEYFEQYGAELLFAAITVPVALVLAIRGWRRRQTVLRNMMLGYLCGVALIFSVDFIFNDILQDHQRLRIESLLGLKDDPMGVGYNVHQSKIAIGSGGLFGKGFLNGTQTRFEFVPEQSTDFIFCTVGEEWGFLGTLAVIVVYLVLILRLLNTAEKRKDRFARIYGYCVACCILMHVFINISMTIGLMPVIGIPLPFLSYGGSALWAFTILLFIYVRLEMDDQI